MMEILELTGPPADRAGLDRAGAVLEAGGVVVLPQRAFDLDAAERRLLDPGISDGRAKNVSLEPRTGRVSGAAVGEDGGAKLKGMLSRFADVAEAVMAELAPRYVAGLQRRRTSFRPGAIADRALSRRKDDRRLHTDAFPSNPTQGRRILRVFANVNPDGQARLWDVGEDGFEALANRYRRRLSGDGGFAWLMERMGATKGRRSPYDQAMLRLHDAAKLDDAFQATTPKRRVAFPSGSMWIVYTDSVLHAALAGQHAFEQTFLMPRDVMERPERSPLSVLERVTGRTLA